MNNEAEISKKITRYLDYGAAGPEGRDRLSPAACARTGAGPPRRAAARVGACAGRRGRRHAGRRAPHPDRRSDLDRRLAHRRWRSLLPILAGIAAVRGNGRYRCRDPDLRPAHRGLRRPGIPELAQALRALICMAAVVAACSVSAPGVAGPLVLPFADLGGAFARRSADPGAAGVRIGTSSTRSASKNGWASPSATRASTRPSSSACSSRCAHGRS